MASHHSCTPSSVPFTVDGCTVSHAPVFVALRNQHVPLTRATARGSSRDSSSLRTIRFRTAAPLFQRQAEWYAVRNSSWPLSAAMRCPVMTQGAVQLSRAIFVGSGRARLAYFTCRRVTPLPGFPSTRPWNRARMKTYRSSCSIRPKASPTLGVTLFMNAYSEVLRKRTAGDCGQTPLLSLPDSYP